MANVNKIGSGILTNVASSVAGGLVGLAGSALQHKYNRELADYQNDINIQNWRMQNEYNTPQAQRERLEAAGLNPGLMYGNGAVSTANAGNIAQYQHPGQDITSNMLNGVQMMSMIANMRKTQAETSNITEDTKSKEIGNVTLGARLQADLDNTLSQTRVNQAEVDYKIKQMSKIDAEIEQIDMNVAVMSEEIKLKIAETDSIKEKTKLTKLQQTTEILNQALTQANTKLTNAKTDTERAMTSNVKADTDLKVAQTVNQYSQAVQADSSSRSINAQALMQEYKNLYYREYGVFPDSNEQMFAMNLITSTSEGEDFGLVKLNYFGDKALSHGEKIADVVMKGNIAKGMKATREREARANRIFKRRENEKDRALKRELSEKTATAVAKEVVRKMVTKK